MPMAHFLREKAIDMGLTQGIIVFKRVRASIRQDMYYLNSGISVKQTATTGYHAWRRSDSHWYVQSRTKFDKTTTPTRLGGTGTT